MRDQVRNAPDSLARAGWEAMRATPYADLGYAPPPQATVSVVPSGVNESERAFRNDSQAARCHALQWVVTNNGAPCRLVPGKCTSRGEEGYCSKPAKIHVRSLSY